MLRCLWCLIFHRKHHRVCFCRLENQSVTRCSKCGCRHVVEEPNPSCEDFHDQR